MKEYLSGGKYENCLCIQFETMLPRTNHVTKLFMYKNPFQSLIFSLPFIGAYYRALPKRPRCVVYWMLNHPEPTLCWFSSHEWMIISSDGFLPKAIGGENRHCKIWKCLNTQILSNFKVLAQDWKQLLYLLSTPSWFCSLHWLVRSQNSHSLTRETAQPTKFNKSLCYKHYKYILKLNIFCYSKYFAWNTLCIGIYFNYFNRAG